MPSLRDQQRPEWAVACGYGSGSGRGGSSCEQYFRGVCGGRIVGERDPDPQIPQGIGPPGPSRDRRARGAWGPIYGAGRGVTSLQFHVYNAGGGIAKGVGYVLWHATDYVVGFVAPMIKPGQTYRIQTDMTPGGSDSEWGGVVACLDLHNHRRIWKLPGTRPTVTKGEDENITLPELYRQAGASPDFSTLTQKKSKVELIAE
jgi:hypothetical protein